MKHCIDRLRALVLGGLLAATLGLGGCDPQAIAELEEGGLLADQATHNAQ